MPELKTSRLAAHTVCTEHMSQKYASCIAVADMLSSWFLLFQVPAVAIGIAFQDHPMYVHCQQVVMMWAEKVEIEPQSEPCYIHSSSLQWCNFLWDFLRLQVLCFLPTWHWWGWSENKVDAFANYAEVLSVRHLKGFEKSHSLLGLWKFVIDWSWLEWQYNYLYLYLSLVISSSFTAEKHVVLWRFHSGWCQGVWLQEMIIVQMELANHAKYNYLIVWQAKFSKCFLLSTNQFQFDLLLVYWSSYL